MSEIPSPDKVMLEATYSDKYGKEQVEKLGLPAYLHMYRGFPIEVSVAKNEEIPKGRYYKWYLDVVDFQLMKNGWKLINYSSTPEYHIFVIDKYTPPPPPEPTIWEKIRSWWYEVSQEIEKEKRNQDQNTQSCIPD